MTDREIILKLLRAVARRMRVARLLSEAGFAAGVVFIALAAYQLVQIPLAGVLGSLDQTILAVALTIFCLYVVLRALKRVSLMQAAGLADARQPLNDELKSALWFVSRTDSTAGDDAGFVQAHIAGAARTAQRLDGAGVLPLKMPRSMLLAGLAAVVFVAAMWGSANLVRAGAIPVAAVAKPFAGDDSPRALLAASASDDEEIRQLDQALALFEKSEASLEQRQQAMIEARDAVDQLNMRAAVTREGLAKLARAMRGRPAFEEIADAIEKGRTEEAIAMLQQMQRELAARPGEQEPGGENGPAVSDRAEIAPRQDIGEVARDLLNETGRTSEESVSRLLKNLEEAEETMERQQRANAAASRMDEMGEMVGMTATPSELGPTAYSDQSETPSGTPSPETGQSDLRGGTMYRQGSVQPNETDEGDDGSTTGSPEGHSTALALEGRATKRLEAQLKLEKVQVTGEDAGEEKDGEESAWFYSASQQEASETALSDVRGRNEYAGADVMRPGRVPMEQRQAVRDYFINIHEGNEQ